MLSASCKSELLHVLLNGLTSHMYSAVPSLPVIHNLFLTNHIPVKPPELDCAVVRTFHAEPSYSINCDAVVPFFVVRNKLFPKAAIPVKLCVALLVVLSISIQLSPSSVE